MIDITGLATQAWNISNMDVTQAIVMWSALTLYLLRRFVLKPLNAKYDLIAKMALIKLHMAERMIRSYKNAKKHR